MSPTPTAQRLRPRTTGVPAPVRSPGFLPLPVITPSPVIPGPFVVIPAKAGIQKLATPERRLRHRCSS